MMKAYNGNKVKGRKAIKPSSVPSFNVIHQNLHGMFQTVKSVGTYLEPILKRFRPAILFLTEVSPHLVEPNVPIDYTFVRGTLKGKDNIRICAPLKVTEKYEVNELNLDIPTVAIKIQNWLFLGLYREWTHGGYKEQARPRADKTQDSHKILEVAQG